MIRFSSRNLNAGGVRGAKRIAVLAATAIVGGAVTATPTEAVTVRSSAPAQIATQSQSTGTGSVPDALQAASLSGAPVEVTALRTTTTSTFANPDGTLTQLSYSVPRFVQASDGTWSPIDTSLVQRADGQWMPAAAAKPFVVSNGGGTVTGWTPLVTTADSSATDQAAWLWHGVLPPPTVSGNVATFADIADGVNIVVTSTPTGFEQSFVLTKAPSGPIALPLAVQEGKGLTVTEGADGSFSLVSTSGSVVASSGIPNEWSQGAQTSSSAPAAASATVADLVPVGASIPSTAVQNQLPTGSSASTPVTSSTESALPQSQSALTTDLRSVPTGDTALVVVPDPTLAAHASAASPLVVDPTVTLYATFDTYVRSDQPNTSYSSATDLEVGDASTSSIYRSFLTFDFTNTKSHVWDPTKLNSSLFKLYEYGASTSGTCTTTQWQMRQARTPTSTTSWATQPTFDATPFATATTVAGGTSCAAKWQSVDATSWTQTKIISGTAAKPAVVLMATSETSASDRHSFYSMDYPGTYDPINMVYRYDYTPYFAVTYTPSVPAAPTNPVAVAGTNQATVSWTGAAADGGSPVTGYTVTSSPDGKTCTTTGALSCTVTGLAVGPYTFTVTATNALGTGPASSASNAVQTASAPSAPTGVTATAGANNATVSWLAPATNGAAITGYTVSSSGDANSPDGLTCTTASALTCSIKGLLPKTSYTFTVTATNVVGTSPASQPSNAVTPDGQGLPPGAPTGVRVRIGQGSAVIAWQAPNNVGAGVSSYLIKATDASANQTQLSVSSTLTAATLNGLGTGPYTFSVSAVNANGNSSSQAGAAATLSATPTSLPTGTQPSQSITLLSGPLSGTTSPSTSPNIQQVVYTVTANVFVPTGGGQIYLAGDPNAIQGGQIGPWQGYLTWSNTQPDGTVVPWGPWGPGGGAGPITQTALFKPGWNHAVFTLSQWGGGNAYSYSSPFYLVGASGYVTSVVSGPGSLLNQTDRHCYGADPVDCRTGGFYQTYTDLNIAGRGVPLDLTRTYNSLTAGNDSPFGYGWASSYDWFLTADASGAVTVHEPTGSLDVFQAATTDPTFGQALPYVAPPGVDAGLVANPGGGFTLTIERKTILKFNSAGQLVAETDLNGLNATTSTGLANPYWTTLAYDPATNRLLKVTDPSGRTLTFAYTDSSIHIASVADSTGRQATYTYTNGDLTGVTDIAGGITTFVYYPNHLIHTIQPPGNGQTSAHQVVNVYNSSNQVTQQTNLDGYTTAFAYTTGTSSAGSPTSITLETDPRGFQIQRTYTSGQLTQVIRGYGTTQNPLTTTASTTAYMYGDASVTQPTDVITYDANNTKLLETRYTYVPNSFGRLQSKEDFDATGASLGDKVSYTYDPTFGQIATSTSPTGTSAPGTQTITRTYDANGNLTRSTATDTVDKWNRSVSYAYTDPLHPGDLSSITDANGNPYTTASGTTVTNSPATYTTTFQYDQYGNRIWEKDGYGNTTTWLYDTRSFLIWKVTPRGNITNGIPAQFKTQYWENAFGETTKILSPLGQETDASYYPDGSTQTATDAAGNKTTYSYWPSGLPYQVQKTGNVTTYTYDPAGNLSSVQDGAGRSTSYQYDALDRIHSKTVPGGGTTLYDYDTAGRLYKVTRPDLTTATLTYAPLGQIQQTVFSDGTPTTSATYWPNGQEHTSSSGSATTTYSYDGLGQLTSEVNGNGQSMGWAYDGAGNNIALAYPDTHTVTRTFDGNERLASVTDWNNKTTAFGYDEDSNLKTITYPNRIVSTTGYNATESPQQIAVTNGGTAIATFGYTTGVAGQTDQLRGSNVASSISGFSPAAETYSYDALNRLATVNADAYTYDATGQPTNVGGVALTNDATTGRLATSGNGATQSTYAYNSEGDRTTTSGPLNTVNAYDSADRLTTITSGATPLVTYSYDAQGLRSSKTVGATMTKFAWEPAGSNPLLLSDGIVDNVYGPGGLAVEQVNGSTTTYLVHDQTGSTRLLFDGTGIVVGTYTFSVYGATLAHTGTATALQWDGQYADSESGYVYLRSRYYDPQTAQFLTRDPLEFATHTPYGFAGSDPVNNSDSTGLFCVLHNPGGGCWGGTEYQSAVTYLDPVYSVIDGYANEIHDAKNGCAGSTLFGESFQGVSGLVGTVLAASAAVGASRLLSGLASGGAAGTQVASVDELLVSGAELDPADAGGQLTRAGRAYAKAGEVFGPTAGGPAAINQAGQAALTEILTNPGTVRSVIEGGNFAGGLRFVSPDGIGAVFGPDGTFQYFGRMTP